VTKQEIIQKVKALGLPDGSYILFGSCPLAAAGIRETSDVDMLVNDEARALLRARGWQERPGRNEDIMLEHGEYDVHSNWRFGTYDPTLEELLATADVFDGVPFASLQEVRKWKSVYGRPKDPEDIKLIDAYLAKQ